GLVRKDASAPVPAAPCERARSARHFPLETPSKRLLARDWRPALALRGLDETAIAGGEGGLLRPEIIGLDEVEGARIAIGRRRATDMFRSERRQPIGAPHAFDLAKQDPQRRGR